MTVFQFDPKTIDKEMAAQVRREGIYQGKFDDEHETYSYKGCIYILVAPEKKVEDAAVLKAHPNIGAVFDEPFFTMNGPAWDDDPEDPTADCETCGISRMTFVEHLVLLDKLAWASRELYMRYKERIYENAATRGMTFTHGEYVALSEVSSLLDEYRKEHLDGSWDEEA